jgi:hypothetical protein
MTTQPIRGRAAAAVVAGALVSSGCGSGDDTAKSATPAPTQATAETATPAAVSAMPAALRGSWQRRMRAGDWRNAGSGYPLGTWRLDVARSGGVGVYLPKTDTVDFSPDVAVNGHRLTIESIPICPGKTVQSSWRASRNALTLKVADDGGCAAGAALFGGTWRRRH